MVRSYVVAHINRPSRQAGFICNRAQAAKELAEAIATELEEWNDSNAFDEVNDWLTQITELHCRSFLEVNASCGTSGLKDTVKQTYIRTSQSNVLSVTNKIQVNDRSL